jgi:hypothetical protein
MIVIKEFPKKIKIIDIGINMNKLILKKLFR